MAICTFFGHRDSPDKIKGDLHKTLIQLITEYNVKLFYIGNHGNFDTCVRAVLHNLKKDYPIKVYTVLAYLRDADNGINYGDTILPEGIEDVLPKYAVCFRNKWMADRSDFVVSYVQNSFGGAYKYSEYAKKHGKTVINLFR